MARKVMMAPTGTAVTTSNNNSNDNTKTPPTGEFFLFMLPAEKSQIVRKSVRLNGQVTVDNSFLVSRIELVVFTTCPLSLVHCPLPIVTCR
jgi:hypothetical protein